MDIKAEMVKLAEEQADSLKDGFVAFINSDEFEEMIAEGLDKAINIPFVKDEKEGPFFREVADLIQKLMVLVLGSK
tara:strand:- start:6442 stop:6669 length:228 start_codon:yes stop_codon:yes gene_type:complete